MEVHNSSEHEHYEYNDYFNPENSIRLLKFLDVSTDKNKLCEISCKLVTWELSKAGDIPRFNAISYTWGDANIQGRMLINGRVLIITKNCEDALNQARRYNKDAWYWVDSVCIDQHNKKEKALQVPLMSRIYGDSENVLACVGQHTGGSNELFRFIENVSEILRPGQDQSSIAQLYSETCAHTLEEFLNRSYFTRVWIFQELHLATRVTFLCGPDSVSADEIYGLSCHIRDLPMTRKLLEAAVSGGNSRISLQDALQKVYSANLQCHVVEDKIFGVLAVVDWQDKARIIPNYEERDVFSLAVTVSNKILELEGRDSQTSTYGNARLIGGLLGLLDSGLTSGLDAAINRRRPSNPSISPRELFQAHPEEDRTREAVTCYGWRIREGREGSHWALKGHQWWCDFDIPVPSKPVEGDKKQIWLPEGTKPGDWYLVPAPEGGKPHFLRGVVLIVRTSSIPRGATDPECHNIVGIGFDHGLAVEGLGRPACYDSFGVVASCEDRLFLLMAVEVYHQAVDKGSSQETDSWSQVCALLEAGPCGATDLSFAFSVP